jgi:hypothetical protein
VNRKSDTVMHQILMQDMAAFYTKCYLLHATECYIDGKKVHTKAEVEAGTATALSGIRPAALGAISCVLMCSPAAALDSMQGVRVISR